MKYKYDEYDRLQGFLMDGEVVTMDEINRIIDELSRDFQEALEVRERVKNE